MRPKELKDLLLQTVPAGLPILIKGAPGVGKSEIVSQVAAELGTELVISHPVVSDPTDFKGLPAVVDGGAEFLPFGDLKKLIDAKKQTIAFLDDLGQAPAVVQAAAMQLILARRVNGHRVSDAVTFIAATNRREDKAGVTGILEPVKSRFASIVELNVHVEDWVDWAARNNVAAEMIAFIRFRPQLLIDTGRPTNDIVNRPSPRTVTYASKLFSLGITSYEALAGAAGEGFAAEFTGFVRVCQAMPSIDEILDRPETATVPTEPAALFAVATALASRTSNKTATAILKYASRLPAEFGVLTVRDSLRQYPQAANNKAFIQWASENKDILL